MDRSDLIKKLKSDNPNALDYIIELLVDVHLKSPEWIKNEARRLQREDLKGGKYKKKVEPVAKQTIFQNVEVEINSEADIVVEHEQQEIPEDDTILRSDPA